MGVRKAKHGGFMAFIFTLISNCICQPGSDCYYEFL